MYSDWSVDFFSRDTTLRKSFSLSTFSPCLLHLGSRETHEAVCLHKNKSKLFIMLSNTNTIAATALSRSQESPCTDKNFPSRLYRFLNLVESYDLSHIASWQPHGRCFRIHNPKEFVNLTEPRYVNLFLYLYRFAHYPLKFPFFSWFVYSKYSSFQRQLNIYGFTRITSGSDKNCYFHEHFLRGQKHLLHKIIRIPTKKDAPFLSRVLTQTPDFDVMPAVNETADSSTSEAHPGLPIAMLNSRIQHLNSSADHVQADSDVERRIELLRRTNLQCTNETIQQQNAARRYRDLLLNSNPPTPAVSRDALILQMLQNRTSMSAASELSLALSQFHAPVEAPLSLQTVPLELLRRQQLNLAPTTALPLGFSQSNQIRTSQFESLSAGRSTLASLLQQQDPRNQARVLVLDPLRQMRYSDPLLLNQIPSVATRSLQNQLLEHQLNRFDVERRLNAMSFLPNAAGGLLTSVTGPSGRPKSDNLDNTNSQHADQRSASDNIEVGPNVP